VFCIGFVLVLSARALERQLLICPNQLGLTLQSTRGHVGIYESETSKTLSASILVGQPIAFTATNVSGGYPPYSYQWYLNGNPVLGVTLDNWTFIPTTSGTYCVYLKVTDTTNNTAMSETVRIIAQSIPVGGYFVSLPRGVWASQETAYFMLVVLFGTVLSLKKPTRKLRSAKCLRVGKAQACV
jgi:hypothetical protein